MQNNLLLSSACSVAAEFLHVGQLCEICLNHNFGQIGVFLHFLRCNRLFALLNFSHRCLSDGFLPTASYDHRRRLFLFGIVLLLLLLRTSCSKSRHFHHTTLQSNTQREKTHSHNLSNSAPMFSCTTSKRSASVTSTAFSKRN